MRWVSRVVRLAVPALAVVLLGSCGGGNERGGEGGRVRAVAAFYPVAEALRQVGGEGVVVTDLTPPGAEPHDLELTTGQVDAIQDADLAVVMGAGFQPAVEDAAGARDGVTVELLEGDAPDPHLWLDPVGMQGIVLRVERALARADRRNAARYERNARAYAARLGALHQRYRMGLARCRRRTIVTAHAAFGRLTARYGLTQEAIAGISPEQEPDPQRLAELADLAERTGITTIFTERLVSPRVAQALAREAGGLKTATLDPLESLSEQRRRAGEDYLSVMDENLAALRKALDCQ